MVKASDIKALQAPTVSLGRTADGVSHTGQASAVAAENLVAAGLP